MSLTVTKTDQLHPITGQPIYHYCSTDDDGIRIDDPSLTDAERADLTRFRPVVQTGPVRGTVTLVDGTSYNVADDYVEVATVDHAGEVSHHIGVRHETDGHPLHKPRDFRGDDNDPVAYDPLVDEYHHTCSAHCGEAARSPEQQEDDFADRLVSLGYAHLVDTTGHRSKLAHLAEMRATATTSES